MDGARAWAHSLMEGRPLVASAATGSLSSAILWLLQEALRGQREVPIPPSLELDIPYKIDIPLNFWAGLLVGFFLWPLLEILVLAKQWITISLRNRISGASASSAKLYKVI